MHVSDFHQVSDLQRNI